MTSHRSALLKTVLAAALLHGLFTVTIPVLILRRTDGKSVLATNGVGHIRWMGAALGILGIYLYVACLASLLRSQASAVPGAKPTVLVTDGWYARTRNPVLLGVVSILFGEAVLFLSPAMAVYALLYWLWLTVFVALKEEPDVRQVFGEQFDAYCRDVPRWIPKF